MNTSSVSRMTKFGIVFKTYDASNMILRILCFFIGVNLFLVGVNVAVTHQNAFIGRIICYCGLAGVTLAFKS